MCRRSRKPFSFCFSSFFTCRRRLLPLFFCPSASLAAATTVFVGDDSAFDFCLPPHTALCFRTNYHNNSFSFPAKPTWTTTQSITKQQNTPTPRKTTGQARPSHARYTADTFWSLNLKRYFGSFVSSSITPNSAPFSLWWKFIYTLNGFCFSTCIGHFRFEGILFLFPLAFPKMLFFLPIKTHRHNQFSSVDRWRTHSLTHRK